MCGDGHNLTFIECGYIITGQGLYLALFPVCYQLWDVNGLT